MRYNCYACKYFTDHKGSYDKHLKSTKHQKLKSEQNFYCQACNKYYCSKQSLNRHCNKFHSTQIIKKNDKVVIDLVNPTEIIKKDNVVNVDIVEKIVDKLVDKLDAFHQKTIDKLEASYQKHSDKLEASYQKHSDYLENEIIYQRQQTEKITTQSISNTTINSNSNNNNNVILNKSSTFLNKHYSNIMSISSFGDGLEGKFAPSKDAIIRISKAFSKRDERHHGKKKYEDLILTALRESCEKQLKAIDPNHPYLGKGMMSYVLSDTNLRSHQEKNEGSWEAITEFSNIYRIIDILSNHSRKICPGFGMVFNSDEKDRLARKIIRHSKMPSVPDKTVKKELTVEITNNESDDESSSEDEIPESTHIGLGKTVLDDGTVFDIDQLCKPLTKKERKMYDFHS